MPTSSDSNPPPATSASRPGASSLQNSRSVAAKVDNFTSPAAIARFVLTTLLLLLADQVVKHVAFSQLMTDMVVSPDGHIQVRSKTWELIPRLVHLEVTANQGAVFGLGQGQRWSFVFVSLLAIAFLTFLFRRGSRAGWYQIVLGMLLAGVLGNMVDRIRLGYVRDMIHGLPGWHWPHWFISLLPDWSWKYGEVFPWIFNVADSLLCVGVGILILHGLLVPPPPAPATDPPTAPKPSPAA
jgi:lipoprotein signal peptidase